VLDVRIPSGKTSSRTMSVSPVDGAVYFATDNTADLYRYRPGTDQVEQLAKLSPNQRIWELAVGTDGTVWAGTYPGGRLISYDPEAKQVEDFGQAIAGEQYIEAIEQVGDEVVVGTQSNGKLASFDPASKTFTEIELPPGNESDSIDELNLRGSLLFVTTKGKALIRDTASNTWIGELPGLSGRGVSPIDPATGNTVYFRTADGGTARYNVETHQSETLNWRPNASPEAWEWVDLGDPNLPGLSIAFTFYTDGRVYGYNPATGRTYYQASELMGSGAPIVTIETGPDGVVYAGAYLTPPGMGRLNSSDTWDLLTGAGQIEGFGSYQGDLVFGRYPQGSLWRFDLDRPWSPPTNPGPVAEIGQEQNRPQSFVELGDQVAVSSVPSTGRHGGAISLWKPDTNQVEVFRNVVTNQTPVSLVEHDGIIYGGTSINGGYGIDPVTPEAKLFAWDPTAHQTLWETVPVPGAPTIAGLVVDGKGRLWALAGGTLFEFDLKHRKVLHRFRISAEPDESRYGNDHELLFHEGKLYGVTANRLFSFDPRNHRVKVLHAGGSEEADTVRHLTIDARGDLYVIARSTHVYRYRLSTG
jgi:streptogramin lyase